MPTRSPFPATQFLVRDDRQNILQKIIDHIILPGLLQAIAKSQVLSNVSAAEFESLELNGEVLKPRQKLSSLKLGDDATFFLKLKKSTPSFPSFPLDDEEDGEPKKLDENASEEGNNNNEDKDKKEEENGEKEEGPKGPDGEEKEKKKEKKEEFKGFAVTRKDIVDKVCSKGCFIGQGIDDLISFSTLVMLSALRQ
jgi:hypothetical protein